MEKLLISLMTAAQCFHGQSPTSLKHRHKTKVQDIERKVDKPKEEESFHITHIDDEFMFILNFKNEVPCMNMNCSINIGHDLRGTPYPLTPVVWINGVATSNSADSLVPRFILDSRPSSICHSDRTADITEFYPQFDESDMQLTNEPSSPKSRCRRLAGFCGCITFLPPQSTKTSRSKRIDTVTTLHVMLGNDK